MRIPPVIFMDSSFQMQNSLFNLCISLPESSNILSICL